MTKSCCCVGQFGPLHASWLHSGETGQSNEMTIEKGGGMAQVTNVDVIALLELLGEYRVQT